MHPLSWEVSNFEGSQVVTRSSGGEFDFGQYASVSAVHDDDDDSECDQDGERYLVGEF